MTQNRVIITYCLDTTILYQPFTVDNSALMSKITYEVSKKSYGDHIFIIGQVGEVTIIKSMKLSPICFMFLLPQILLCVLYSHIKVYGVF